MMRNIGYAIKNINTFFEDDRNFNEEYPYKLWRKYYKEEEHICLHYHNMLEILVCSNVRGYVFIENKRYRLEDHRIFIVPPETVHSFDINRSTGNILILQISLKYIMDYIRIDTLFTALHTDISGIRFVSNGYARLQYILEELLNKNSENAFYKLKSFLSIFELLAQHAVRKESPPLKKDSKIRKIVDWTSANFAEKITIGQAAEVLGLTKYYFCKYFKRLTGITYFDYLTQLRLSRSQSLLRQKRSVTEVCFSCGFDNLSYFISVFKKHYGITPKKISK
ncbi:AraC family transcriptional regulator [Spirochaetota bacterium]